MPLHHGFSDGFLLCHDLRHAQRKQLGIQTENRHNDKDEYKKIHAVFLSLRAKASGKAKPPLSLGRLTNKY